MPDFIISFDGFFVLLFSLQLDINLKNCGLHQQASGGGVGVEYLRDAWEKQCGATNYLQLERENHR